MRNPSWQLKTPISAIIFDCDGTLTTIEGIDELAKNSNVSASVESLTAQAMGVSGINPELYQKRLNLVHPKETEILNLGQSYIENCVQDADAVIQIFKRLQKKVYIVSAGLYPAIEIFATHLQISRQHIYAVNIFFDDNGNYLDFDQTSPLIHNTGKRDIVKALKTKHPDLVYIGDGLNDYAVYDLVTRFVGYGGVFYRQHIADQCEFYINTFSLAPLLPLVLTREEWVTLLPTEKEIYARGLEAVEDGKIKIA